MIRLEHDGRHAGRVSRARRGVPRAQRANAGSRSVLLASLFVLSCNSADPSSSDGHDGAGSNAMGQAGRAGGNAGGAGSDLQGGASGKPSAAGAGGRTGSEGEAGGAGLTGGRSSSGGAGGGAGSAVAGGNGAGGAWLSGCRIDLRCEGKIIDGEKVPCATTIVDGNENIQYSGIAGIELRGRSSMNYPKKNYSLELRVNGEEENPANLLGMGQEADWVLDGSWLDRSFMRNDLVFELYRAAGHYAPESRYCALRLNDQDRGIYRLCERIKRDDDRLDLTEDDGTGQTFVIKQDAGGPLRLDIGLQKDWQLVYPNQERSTEQQRAGVQAWLDGLEAAMKQALDGNAEDVFASLSLEATVDWILVQELSKNIDAYHLSLHLHRDAGGLAIPTPWDLDLAFGQPRLNEHPSARNEDPEGWIFNRTELIEALSNSTALLDALGPRWRALRSGPYADARVQSVLDRFAAALHPSDVARNFEIWPLEAVDFERFYPPYSLYRIDSHAAEVQKLRSWVQARLHWIDDNIDAYPRVQ